MSKGIVVTMLHFSGILSRLGLSSTRSGLEGLGGLGRIGKDLLGIYLRHLPG